MTTPQQQPLLQDSDDAIAAKVNKYIEARDHELDRIESDMKNEHDLGVSMEMHNRADMPLFEMPAEGSIMLQPGGAKEKDDDTTSPPPPPKQFRTSLIEMRVLKEKAAVAGFDGADAPFTLRALYTVGTTPDLALIPHHQGKEVNTSSSSSSSISSSIAPQPPEPQRGEDVDTQIDARDFGQCLGQDWFYEAGGVDFFLNAILGNRAQAAHRARHAGTLPDPSTTAAGCTPASVYAAWKVDRDRRMASSTTAVVDVPRKQGAPPPPPPSKQEQEAEVTETLLASKFWDSLGEVREISALHIAYYLFEPCGRERPCVMGERCIARMTVYHPMHDAPPPSVPTPPNTMPGSRRRMGVTLKEFMTDLERERFDRFGELPAVHHPCILCMRCNVTFKYFMSRLEVARYATLYHYHPVEVPGGYRRSACIQPSKANTRGVVMPTRPFATNEYIPTTLDELAWAGALPLTPAEINRLRAECAAFISSSSAIASEDAKQFAGKCGLPRLRGYAEVGSVLYFEKTKALTPQAVSVGTEPCSTYVGALAACASANVDPVINNKASPPSGTTGGGFALYPACLFSGEFGDDDELSSMASTSLKQALATKTAGGAPPPLLPPTTPAKKRQNERCATCDQGEHAGHWRHLVIEFAIRVGITLDTMDVILGPFPVLCELMATALCKGMTTGGGTSNLTLNELIACARRLRLWNRMPPPEPLSRYAVFVSSAVRTELIDMVRESIEQDAVFIARSKFELRKDAAEHAAELSVLNGSLSYASWETLADDEAKITAELERTREAQRSNKSSRAAGGHEQRISALGELLNAIKEGKDAWIERKRKATDAARASAAADYNSRLVPYPVPTRVQKELDERLEAIVESAVGARLTKRDGEIIIDDNNDNIATTAAPTADEEHRLATLASLIRERRKKRPSQKTLDRLLQVLSEFEFAQRPLCHELAAIQDAGLPFDDAALLGTATTTGGGGGVCYSGALFGSLNPDTHTPALRVPRKPLRLTLSPSAAVIAKTTGDRFDRSGLPDRVKLPAPCSHSVPDVPVCRIRFPSHRRVLCDFVAERLWGGIPVDVFLLPQQHCELQQQLQRDGSTPALPSVRKLLSEFWKAVQATRNAGSTAARTMLDLLGPFAQVCRALALKDSDLDGCSILATVLARVAIGERIQRIADATGDSVLSFRAHAFVMTHAQLLSAISARGRIDDKALLADPFHDIQSRRPTQTYGLTWECIANAYYPFDGAAMTEEDLVPIASELTACGFFEQASDPDSSKTLEHVIKKIMPRACEKRACESIMNQTASSCPAFAMWFLEVLRCFLRGSYAHARVRPSLLASFKVCDQFLRDARSDLELRIAEVERRPFAIKHSQKCAKLTRCIAPLRDAQFSRPLEIARILRLAETTVSTALGGSRANTEPFATAARLIDTAVATAISLEVARTVAAVAPDLGARLRTPQFHCQFAEALAALAAKDAGVFVPAATTDEYLSDRSRRSYLARAFVDCIQNTDAAAAVVFPKETLVAAANAVIKAIRVLGNGALSEIVCGTTTSVQKCSCYAADAIADTIVRAVRAGYGAALARTGSTHRAAFADPEAFFTALFGATVEALCTLSATGNVTDAIAALDGNPLSYREEEEDEEEEGTRQQQRRRRRSWNLSHESVVETCIAACSRALEYIGGAQKITRDRKFDVFCTAIIETCRKAAADACVPALACGLADSAFSAMAAVAGDIVDTWDAVVTACGEPNGRTAVINVINGAAAAVAEFASGPENNLAELLRTRLVPAVASRTARQELERSPGVLAAITDGLVSAIAGVRAITGPWEKNKTTKTVIKKKKKKKKGEKKENNNTTNASNNAALDTSGQEPLHVENTVSSSTVPPSAERAMLLAGRFICELVRFAGCIAERAREYADSKQKCELLRRGWEYYAFVTAKLLDKAAFVVKHATLCQFAVREAVLAQMARNPALVAAFVTRGSWFPEFNEYVIRVCDETRRRIMRDGAVPPDNQIAQFADDMARGSWWANKVYRLRKWDFAARVVKTVEQHENAIAAAGIRVGPAFALGDDRIKLLREYVFSSAAALGADRRPNLARDIDVLWRFGMRDHGLSIVADLHDAYENYGGKNEFYWIVSLFSVAEERLVAEYYRALSAANSVSIVPLMSPVLSDSIEAALRERYALGEGAIPDQIRRLVLCDVCNSVLTQMPPRTSTRPSKLTSCYAVLAGPNGQLVCLDKRNSVKKKTTARHFVKDKEEEEDDEEEEQEEEEEEEEEEEDNGVDDDSDTTKIICKSRKRPRPHEKTRVDDREPPTSKRRKLSRCNRCSNGANASSTTPEASVLRTIFKCQETRVREIAGAGCLIEFSQKYTAKGEKSTEARLPIILTPCCGTWRRFSFEDWGPDGYRCCACAVSRQTGNALPTTCAICGDECRLRNNNINNNTGTNASTTTSKTKSASGRQFVTTTIPKTSSVGYSAFASSSFGTARLLAAASLPPLGGTENPIKWIPVPALSHRAKRIQAAAAAQEKGGHRKKLKLIDGENIEKEKQRRMVVMGDEETRGEEEEELQVEEEKEIEIDYYNNDGHNPNYDNNDEAPEYSSVVVQNLDKRRLYGSLYQNIPGLEGTLAPVPSGATNIVCIIDDDVTMSIIPVAACRRCFFEHLRGSHARPVLLSELRARVRKRIHDPSSLMASLRRAGVSAYRLRGGGRGGKRKTF